MNNIMNKLKGNKRGFTLIELIVVVAIIGILVLIAAPRFTGFTKDAKVATMQADVKTLSNAALVYNIENEDWPVADPKSPTHTVTIGETQVKLFEIDETKADFTNLIKGTKNDVDSYRIAIKDKYEGEIFYVAGEEGRDGQVNYGANFVAADATVGQEVVTFPTKGD